MCLRFTISTSAIDISLFPDIARVPFGTSENNVSARAVLVSSRLARSLGLSGRFCSCSIHQLFLPRCVAVLLLSQTHTVQNIVRGGRGRASFRYYNHQFMGWCDVGVASPLPRGECVCVLCTPFGRERERL